MMYLSIRIDYQTEQEKKLNEKILPRIIMTFSFFLVFLLAVFQFWPEGREVLRLIMIPGTPQDTIAALETFVSELDCGISISGAATDFWQKLIG